MNWLGLSYILASKRPVREPSRLLNSTFNREEEINAISDPEKKPERSKVVMIATVNTEFYFSLL